MIVIVYKVQLLNTTEDINSQVVIYDGSSVFVLKLAPHFCNRMCGSSKKEVFIPGPGASTNRTTSTSYSSIHNKLSRD